MLQSAGPIAPFLLSLGSCPSFYLAREWAVNPAGGRPDAGHQTTALRNLLTFLVKKDREGTGEIALPSSERREVQRNSGICLNELEVRGQKWDCGSESYLGLYIPISFALSVPVLHLWRARTPVWGIRSANARCKRHKSNNGKKESLPQLPYIILGSDSFNLWEVLMAPYQ